MTLFLWFLSAFIFRCALSLVYSKEIHRCLVQEFDRNDCGRDGRNTNKDNKTSINTLVWRHHYWRHWFRWLMQFFCFGTMILCFVHMFCLCFSKAHKNKHRKQKTKKRRNNNQIATKWKRILIKMSANRHGNDVKTFQLNYWIRTSGFQGNRECCKKVRNNNNLKHQDKAM